MELGSGVIKYYPRNKYGAAKKLPSASSSSLQNKALENKVLESKTKAQENLNISDHAKELAKDEVANKLTTSASSLPSSSSSSSHVTKEAEKIKNKGHDKEASLVKRPALIFIGGFHWFGLGPSNAELKKFGQVIDGAEYFHHIDKEKIIGEIQKRSLDEKVVLVGQGLGADTAVEIANELNALKYGFRKIDLLVTLDARGFNNDIVPQNVKKNLNFILDSWNPFADGPNIAKNVQKTEVINHLCTGNILDSKEVQYKIMESLTSEMSS